MDPLSQKPSPTQPRKGPDLRRSQRVMLRVPIIVMGTTPEGNPFSEETITLVVNAHGALIALTSKVVPGQKLGMVNLSSGEELACRVMREGAVNNGRNEVGIEFTHPAPFFWRVSFPPSDWAPHAAP
jgi:hypothetical protein